MSGSIVDFLKLRRFPGRSLPPIQEEHRGQFVMESGDDSTTDDEFYIGASDNGSLEWRKVITDNHGFPADQVTGFGPKARGEVGVHATFGPFYANDLAASATVALTAGFFDTATALSRSTPDIYMPNSGEIVGIYVIADANRSAGTATINPTVNGVAQTFDGGAVCQLNGTNMRRHSILAALGDGEDFAAGERVALQVVTSGWAPITANLAAWFTVRFAQ